METTLRMAAKAQQLQAAAAASDVPSPGPMPTPTPLERPTHRAGLSSSLSFWQRFFVPSASFALGAAVAGLVIYLMAVRPLQTQSLTLRAQKTDLQMKNVELDRQRQAQAQRAVRAEQGNADLRKRLATRPTPIAPPKQVVVVRDNNVARKAIEALEAVIAGQFKPRQVALADSGTRDGGDPGQGIALDRPVATYVLDDRPTLKAKPLDGARNYNVDVRNSAGGEVKTIKLSPTAWRVVDPLQRGQVYTWTVEALKDGQLVESPVAKFRVLEKEKADELERAKRQYAGQHLTLGVLYAQAGLLDDAEREFKALLKANPKHSLAGRLLSDVQAERQAE